MPYHETHTLVSRFCSIMTNFLPVTCTRLSASSLGVCHTSQQNEKLSVEIEVSCRCCTGYHTLFDPDLQVSCYLQGVCTCKHPVSQSAQIELLVAEHKYRRTRAHRCILSFPL
jgi:hypothetical protein